MDDFEALALAAAAQKRRSENQTGIIDQFGSGTNEGIASMLGFPVDAMTGALNAGIRGVNNVTGADIGQIEDPVLGSGHLRGILDPLISDVEPQNRAQEIARRFGQEIGASAPVLPLAAVRGGLLPVATVDTAANVGATAAGQAAHELAPELPWVEDSARLVGGVGVGMLGARALGALDNAAAQRRYLRKTETSQELSAKAKAKYEQGHSLGLKIKPKATEALETEIQKIASDAGLITPKGRVIDNADIRQVLDLLEDFQEGNITTRQAQSLRSQIQGIAGSKDPKLSRVGVLMKRTYDDWLGQFAPQFKEANALNTRAMRGEMMDRAEELAEIRAGQYSQSGHENALRTELRQIDRDIAKGRTKGLRPDQVDAIHDVSRGTSATNVARAVGKLAPRGVVSGGFHAFPFTVGTMVGGPVTGAALAGATASTGVLGSALASSLQRNAAKRASAAMRAAQPFRSMPKIKGAEGLLAALLGQISTQAE